MATGLMGKSSCCNFRGVLVILWFGVATRLSPIWPSGVVG